MKTPLLLLVPSSLFLAAGLLFGAAGGGPADDGHPVFGEPGGPSRPLLGDERARWVRGLEIFDRDFHRSTGLGTPNLNADSCRSCHHDLAIGGAGPLDVNVARCGRDVGGTMPFTNVPGGQAISKFRPPWVDGREDQDATADVFEQRQTPAIFGDGLIDGILDETIIAGEDPDDLDGDGIRGIARRIVVGTGQTEIGRFGWKGQVPHLADFLRDAMGGECGITTPSDGRGFALITDQDNMPDPELSQADFDDLAFFMSHLGRIINREPKGPGVERGKAHFTELGCVNCHTPSLPGLNGPVPLYSDLLLHNIMPDGFRGMAEDGAGVGMYQTPPLWGIRHSPPYLHDGRGEDLRGAIGHHHGEANTQRIKFSQLPPREQDALILFLESL